MNKFVDVASKVNERASERMSFRTKPRIKETIQHAAAISGVDDSTFAMNAAYRAALEVIESQERIVLRGEDAAVVLEALDNPKPPTEALRADFARFRERYLSK